MGYKLTVKGKDTATFSEQMITFASVDVNTPMTSMAKSSTVAVTLNVLGKLTTTDSSEGNTKQLLDWSLVPAQSADAYRDVTVEVITSGKKFRTIELPNAFVVDYNERYSDTAGMGEFTLVVRQKADQVSKVKTDDGREAEGQK